MSQAILSSAYFRGRPNGTELDDLRSEFSIPLSVTKTGMYKHDATDFPNAGSTLRTSISAIHSSSKNKRLPTFSFLIDTNGNSDTTSSSKHASADNTASVVIPAVVAALLLL